MGSSPDEISEFFSMYLILPAALGLGILRFTQSLTEMSTRDRNKNVSGE
jgi:hypothetical protein